MAKQPYIPLYTGDYLKDTRVLPLEVRGAWVDLMIFMWESKEKGTLTGTLEDYALMLGCSTEKANLVIHTLNQKSVCDYEVLDNGMIKLSCRRIIRDHALSEKRKSAGSKGGNPILVNQTDNQNLKNGYPFSDNDIDNDNGIQNNKGAVKKFDPSDFYESGAQAFEEVKNDELLIERLVRIVRNKGYRTCTPITVTQAVKDFFLVESAKPEFAHKPRSEIKNHLVNWINKNAKQLSNAGI